MYQYTVTGPVANINQGALVLDDNQLHRRRGIVEIIEPGNLELEEGEHLCMILAPVQFKQGESFFTDQAIDKLQAPALEQTGEAYAYDPPEPEQADKEPDDNPDNDLDEEPAPDDEPKDYADWDTDMLAVELAARDITVPWNAGDEKKRGYLIADDAANAESGG